MTSQVITSKIAVTVRDYLALIFSVFYSWPCLLQSSAEVFSLPDLTPLLFFSLLSLSGKADRPYIGLGGPQSPVPRSPYRLVPAHFYPSDRGEQED